MKKNIFINITLLIIFVSLIFVFIMNKNTISNYKFLYSQSINKINQIQYENENLKKNLFINFQFDKSIIELGIL